MGSSASASSGSGSAALKALGVGVLIVAAAAGIWMLAKPAPTTHIITRAWYAEIGGTPVVVYDHSSHSGPNYSDNPRYSSSGHSTSRLIARNVTTNATLGTRPLGKKASVKGAFGGRMWLHAPPDTPQLLAMDSLATLARAGEITTKLGQRFELPPSGFVNPYTGQLSVKTADGKQHLVGTDLSIDTPSPDLPIPPKDRNCFVGVEGMIQPRLKACLPPDARPATALGVAKTSALRDAPKEAILFAVDATAKPAKVLWKKRVRDLAGHAEEPFFSGTHALPGGRVVVMLATPEPLLHVITLDAHSGEEKARAVVGKRPAK